MNKKQEKKKGVAGQTRHDDMAALLSNDFQKYHIMKHSQ